MGADRLLTPEEAAERLHVCTKTLRQLRRDGLIRYVAVTERKVLYRAEDCEEYLASRVRQEVPGRPVSRRPRRKVGAAGNVVPIRPFTARQGSAAR